MYVINNILLYYLYIIHIYTYIERVYGKEVERR